MNKKRTLIQALVRLGRLTDRRAIHASADDLLLKYIGDPDIANAYDALEGRT